MSIDIAEVLIELCSLPGPSGFEEPVAARVKELLKPHMDEVWTDVLGNVIGVRRCGKKDARKLLFDAHIDEIGLIVTGVEEGFLRFSAIGGLDARMLPASAVEILSDPPCFGVICVQPPHVLKKEDMEKTTKIEDLYIDIGMSQDESVKAVPLGTPGVLANSARRFGENSICGKALDDRAGFVAILRALELISDFSLDKDLYVMASAQEEVGTRGAAPGVYAFAPVWCVVVDVGHAKTPDSKPSEVKEELGGGVVISRGPNMNGRLTETAIKLAAEHEIKYQIDIEPGGNSGTNARVIQIAREGVATTLLGIPLRYMHGTNELLCLDDVEYAARLMCEVAKLEGEAL